MVEHNSTADTSLIESEPHWPIFTFRSSISGRSASICSTHLPCQRRLLPSILFQCRIWLVTREARISAGRSERSSTDHQSINRSTVRPGRDSPEGKPKLGRRNLRLTTAVAQYRWFFGVFSSMFRWMGTCRNRAGCGQQVRIRNTCAARPGMCALPCVCQRLTLASGAACKRNHGRRCHAMILCSFVFSLRENGKL